MSEYEGIIFPLYSEMIERALNHQKDVFVKFSQRKIRPGMKLYLYSTGEGGNRKVVAEGVIENVEYAKPSEAKNEYGDRIFQTPQEFEDYVNGRENREMLVLELDDLKRLEEHKEPSGNVTVAGLYLDEEL
jgi:hypothetical protein